MQKWVMFLGYMLSTRGVIGLSVIVYLVATGAALLQERHFLLNLEPYPDGLLYALSARNATLGEGLRLSYLDSSMDYWVPPLYSLALVPSYLIWSAPQAYMLVNIVLGVGAIVLLGKVIWNTTRSILAVGVALALYLSHGYMLWLPGLPMAENVSLFLIATGLYALFSLENGWKQLLLLMAIATGVVLSKFAAVVLAGALVGASLWQMRGRVKRGHWILLTGAALVIGILYSLLIANPLTMLMSVLASLLAPDALYYGARFVLPNVQGYAAGHLGQNAPFLWQVVPLTSVAVTFPALVYFWRGWRDWTEHKLARARVLSILFFAQFPLLLIFYTPDLRYSIYSIPILTLAVAWFFDAFSLPAQLQRKLNSSTTKCALLGLVFVVQAYSQLPLYKELIASNLLGRSVGWQAESSVQLHESIQKRAQKSGKTAYLITALPPFLYDSYVSADSYQLLPLSIDQEFLSKQRWVWGSEPLRALNDSLGTNFANSTHIKTDDDLDIRAFSQSDLHVLITSLLEQGEVVYISNAYITHQTSVVKHYEEIGTMFTLTEVATGCEGACNVHEVIMKDSSI